MENIEKIKNFIGFVKNKDLALYKALLELVTKTKELQPVLQNTNNTQEEILEAIKAYKTDQVDLTETNNLLVEVKEELSKPVNVRLILE